MSKGGKKRVAEHEKELADMRARSPKVTVVYSGPGLKRRTVREYPA